MPYMLVSVVASPCEIPKSLKVMMINCVRNLSIGFLIPKKQMVPGVSMDFLQRRKLHTAFKRFKSGGDMER